SIIAMIGTLMQNPQKIVNTRSGIDPKVVSKYGQAPGYTYSTNADINNSIKYLDPPQIPSVLFSLLENAKENIREITGLSQAYLGQSVGSLQTSSGVQSLIDRATLRDRDQVYDIELYIEGLTSLIIDFMVSYYEEPRLIRVMGENEDEYEFEEFLGSDYKDIAYDVFVDVSSKTPMSRMKEMQDAQNLVQMQGQYGAMFPAALITPQEFIRSMDLPNKQQILERMDQEVLQNKTEQAMQVAQMM